MLFLYFILYLARKLNEPTRARKRDQPSRVGLLSSPTCTHLTHWAPLIWALSTNVEIDEVINAHHCRWASVLPLKEQRWLNYGMNKKVSTHIKLRTRWVIGSTIKNLNQLNYNQFSSLSRELDGWTPPTFETSRLSGFDSNFDLRGAMLNVPMCTTWSLRQGLKSFLQPLLWVNPIFLPHIRKILYITMEYPTISNIHLGFHAHQHIDR
jgi:hypothetical protein